MLTQAKRGSLNLNVLRILSTSVSLVLAYAILCLSIFLQARRSVSPTIAFWICLSIALVSAGPMKQDRCAKRRELTIPAGSFDCVRPRSPLLPPVPSSKGHATRSNNGRHPPGDMARSSMSARHQMFDVLLVRTCHCASHDRYQRTHLSKWAFERVEERIGRQQLAFWALVQGLSSHCRAVDLTGVCCLQRPLRLLFKC